ncbi:MAG: restriction endonuclease [Phycisphaerales bacterium]
MLTKLKRLPAARFENLIYDLLTVMGLENAVWRTPGRDGGRDIQGLYFVTDLSGYRHPQKWYIECKRYATAVDWPTVREKLSYAESHAADFLLLVTTSTASPQATDEINRWNRLNKRPKVRFWSGHDLVPILDHLPAIQVKYGLSENPSDAMAVSLLPLSEMTLKFVQAAYGEAVFRGSASPALEAAAAMADLSTRRMEQIEEFGSWIREETRRTDIYSWADCDSGADVRSIDRYCLRSLLCAFRSMVKSTRVELSARPDGILLRADGKRLLGEVQRKELLTIAQWGNCELLLENEGVAVIVRTTDEA